jgi:hypothetical protein
MQTVERMISTSPSKSPLKTGLVECIATCGECAQACVACADACLAEEQVAELQRCIRLDEDCADICGTTARLLSRLLQPDVGVLRAQLEACALICASCGAECERHAQRHEHCKVCAEACKRCENHCRKALGSLRPA